MNKLREEQRVARELKIKVIKDLRSYGMTLEEIAPAMGLSKQRIAQLCREKRLKRNYDSIIKLVLRQNGYTKQK